MSNIHGLSFGSSSEGKRADDEEFYGGGATSGTAVWRPTNGPQRQQQPGAAGGPPGAAAGGTGGGDADMRQLIAQARQQAAAGAAGGGEAGAADRLLGTITIYANGFMIGNGATTGFRDARDANNAAFIASLRRGEVPAELEDICRREWGREADTVSVNLVDKHTDTYTPPKPKFSFADSKGQQLSSAGSGGSGGGSEATQQQLASTQRLSRQPAQRYAADGAAPSTTLQIVTADRKKHRETFSEQATVAALYAHVATLHVPAAPSQSFELVAGFPPKVLADGALTLKQAGICGASVQQRSTQ